jgi:mannose-1-phosphate guanylyltransferase
LGSWAALYEHRAAKSKENGAGTNVIEAKGKLSMDADGNYIYAPDKFVAAVGVNDVVVVETDDALLVTTREKSQDVGKLVKQLEELKKKKLL